MGTKSRESIYGSSLRASAERAREARKEADRLACEAWNQRMLGYKGPAQPSPHFAKQWQAEMVKALEVEDHATEREWGAAFKRMRRRLSAKAES